MGLDKKFLSESYKRMSDGELMAILSNDYNDLTEDAREVLKSELTERGIGNGLDKAIEVQLSEISTAALQEYVEIIRSMDCPLCLGTENKLNAVVTFNTAYPEFTIGCPSCLDKTIGNATGESMGRSVLGGIGGVVKSVNNISLYRKLLTQIQANEPSDALIAFVKKRAGEIELNKENTDRLETMIKHPNATIY